MKKIMVIVLVVTLLASGLGGFAFAQVNGHEPMTGQKLVSFGGYCADPSPDGTYTFQDAVFLFTNPDCVSEITINRISIIGADGTLIYEGLPLDREGNPLPQTLGPHGLTGIVLRDYVSRYYDHDPMDYLWFPKMVYTVEIFWSGAKEGLPLTGWADMVVFNLDEAGNQTGLASESWVDMVNMEQILTTDKTK